MSKCACNGVHDGPCPLSEVELNSPEFLKREQEVGEANDLLFTLDSSSTRIRDEDRSFLLGRVLTVVDAVSIEETQRKAVKDLIHSAFAEFKTREQRLFCEMFNRVSEALNGDDRIELVDNPWEKNRLPRLK